MSEKIQVCWYGGKDAFGAGDVALLAMRRTFGQDWKYRSEMSLDKQLLYSWAGEYAGERAQGLLPEVASAKLWPHYSERGMASGAMKEIMAALEEEIAAELARLAGVVK